MIDVSTQAELRAALNAREPEIRIINNIDVTSQIAIDYTVTISGFRPAPTFFLSKTANFSGYLFRVNPNGNLTLNYLTLDGKNAGSYEENPNNRSLIMVAGGNLHLGNETWLQYNSSYQEGGGVYLSGDPSYTNTMLMDENSRVQYCSSRTSGGGIAVALRHPNDSITIRDAQISNNTAANGGGIYYRPYVTGIGGALTIGANNYITGNTAAQGGGGIFFSGYQQGNSLESVLQISDLAYISNNRATNGAGIYFYSANQGDLFSITGSPQIRFNQASGNGGAIYLTARFDSTNFRINGTPTINNNSANYGGAIYLTTTAGGTLELNQCTLDNNQANVANGSSGGAIWLGNTSTMNPLECSFRDVILRQNSANAQGGALFLSNTSSRFNMFIANSTLETNTAGTNGGGITVGTESGGSINIENCTFQENNCQNSGGAMYFTNTAAKANSQITLSNCILNGNQAGYEGGSLRFTSGNGILQTTMQDCQIINNTATNNSGGGVWYGGINASLTVSGNTTFENNSTRQGNGGGIFFNSQNGILRLSDHATFRSNRASDSTSNFGNQGGGLCVVPGSVFISGAVEFANNTALQYGGAISTSGNSTVTMTGGTISNNTSGNGGGAVYNNNGSHFLMSGGTMDGNQAAIGGAFYNNDSAILEVSGNGKIGVNALNTASRFAPGIYNNALFYTEGNRNLANGLYIANQGAIAYLQGALAAGSIVQLNNSGYVTPTKDGSPIVVAEQTAQYGPLTQTDADAFRKPSNDFDYWETRLSDDQTQVWLAPIPYLITYLNLEGAAHSNPDTYNVTTPDILLTAPAARPGYRFIGWFDAITGGNQITKVPQGSNGNLIFFARWEAVYQTITFYGNDVGGPPAQDIPDPIPVQYSHSVMLPDSPPDRNGYQFTGWNTNAEGSGEDYQPGDTIDNVTADINLYAQWQLLPPTIHTITYHGNDVGGLPAHDIPEPIRVEDGQSATLSPTPPTRQGYAFQSWNTSSDGSGKSYPAGGMITNVTADTNLYAQWQLLPPTIHIIIYHGNNEENPPAQFIPSSIQVLEAQDATLSTLIPIRSGYIFCGWNTTPLGAGTTYLPGDAISLITADIDLYAQWQALPPI